MQNRKEEERLSNVKIDYKPLMNSKGQEVKRQHAATFRQNNPDDPAVVHNKKSDALKQMQARAAQQQQPEPQQKTEPTPAPTPEPQETGETSRYKTTIREEEREETRTRHYGAGMIYGKKDSRQRKYF